MMKIALTTDSFVEGQGGVSTAVAALAYKLQEHGHEVRVYTAADPTHDKQDDLDIVGFNALRYEHFPGGRVPLDPVSLVQELKDFKPDIVHNHSMGTMGIQTLASVHLLGIPVLATCHVFLAGFLKYAPINLENVPLTKEVAWRYTTAFFNRFPCVTTPSKAMLKELVQHGLNSPAFVVSNGVDTSLFTQGKRKDGSPASLLHVGRLGYEKRVDVVLRAFALVLTQFPETRLDIVGDGPERENLEALARELGIAGSVRFLGKLPHRRLPAIYRQADVFVTASTIETQGLVVLEAMASGLPVVGVDAMALPELIHQMINGLLVPPGDESAFADAVARLLSSTDLQRKMGLTSRRLALEHSLPVVAQAYEDLYQQAILQTQQSLLTNNSSKFDPSVARSSLFAKGQVLKNTGAERFWERRKALLQRAKNTSELVVELAHNNLSERWR